MFYHVISLAHSLKGIALVALLALAPAPILADDPEIWLISEIQGTPDTWGRNRFGHTDVSPLLGHRVTVEAVVVGDFQSGDEDPTRDLGGFFLQEETWDEDDDPRSSEGIFVFDQDFGVNVQLGDRVRVTGVVDHYFGETRISQVSAVEVLASNRLKDVTPARISLSDNTAVTRNQNGAYQPDLEFYEGMWVIIEEPLQITEQFRLGRFNEIKLIAGDRPFQFTQKHAPNAQAFDAHQRSVAARSIVYDDGRNVQNAPVHQLDGFEDYREATAKRMGDQVVGLSGVLDYKWAGNPASGATWRIRSQRQGANPFTSTKAGNSPNPRPLQPPEVAGEVRIASFNVLNLFHTLDRRNARTARGLSPRGARNELEQRRQMDKLVNTLVALDAAVVGLVELENEFYPQEEQQTTALGQLVTAINERLQAPVYDYVYPGQRFVGTDAIAVGIIYQPAQVKLTPGSQVAMLNDTLLAQLPGWAEHDFQAAPVFDGPATNRVPLAAHFTHRASGGTFKVVANHFKAKGTSGISGDGSANDDQGDGAAYWNQRRLHAAQALLAWLATHPTGLAEERVVIMGDLNAYAQEAPIQYLLAEGYHSVHPPGAYSYVFDGQKGTLDYMLLSDALWPAFQQAAVWNINADEASVLDFSLKYGRSATLFDNRTPTRSSDHDPMLVGLNPVPPKLTPAAVRDYFLLALASGELAAQRGNAWQRTLYLFRYFDALDRAAVAVQLGHDACPFYQPLMSLDYDASGLQGDGAALLLRNLEAVYRQLAC